MDEYAMTPAFASWSNAPLLCNNCQQGRLPDRYTCQFVGRRYTLSHGYRSTSGEGNRGLIMMAKKGRSRRRQQSDGEQTRENITNEAQYGLPDYVPAKNFVEGNRVNNKHTTMSVRQQIKYARLRQSDTDNSLSTNPLQRTKFRKRKTLQEIKVDSKSLREFDAISPVPSGKYSLGPPPVIFIDGYNCINQWGKLKKRFERGDLATSRQLLIEEILEFAAIRGWYCVVVFDAMGGTTENISTEQISENVEVVFTGSSTADTYIERETYLMCKLDKRQVWAATSDFAQQKVALGQGAHVISAARFVEELVSAKKEVREKIKEEAGSGTGQSRTIIQAVDPDTRDKLYNLRSSLGWRVAE